MRLLLINPSNSLVSIVKVKESRWNRYRVWKPLGLMVLAGLTPPQWDISIIDENLEIPDYSTLPKPDLVGITAFTSQANRAYELSDYFRAMGVPVVMGGIHATMCLSEAREHVDCVVTGEAESIWSQVLEDTQRGDLKPCYDGGLADIEAMRPARHDLTGDRYAFGALQTTRGCPLNCSFCSVTAFNGASYRQRPIADVINEFGRIREKRVLVVDDNLIGTSPRHIERTRALFKAMIDAGLQKEWIAQVTINFADDEELLKLARKAGCAGVFIGFESPSPDGLAEVGKKFNLLKSRDFRASVRRIQKHHMLVVGSFIIGLDVDKPGIGRQIADAAHQYGVDNLNTLFLTPLPGTELWDQMKDADRIYMNSFPEDWRYYTLTFPTAQYCNMSTSEIIDELVACDTKFYSMPNILKRVLGCLLRRRMPVLSLIGNLSCRRNLGINCKAYDEFRQRWGIEQYCPKSSANQLNEEADAVAAQS